MRRLDAHHITTVFAAFSCMSPFPSAGTALTLFRAKTVETTVVAEGQNMVARLWDRTPDETGPPELTFRIQILHYIT